MRRSQSRKSARAGCKWVSKNSRAFYRPLDRYKDSEPIFSFYFSSLKNKVVRARDRNVSAPDHSGAPISPSTGVERRQHMLANMKSSP